MDELRPEIEERLSPRRTTRKAVMPLWAEIAIGTSIGGIVTLLAAIAIAGVIAEAQYRSSVKAINEMTRQYQQEMKELTRKLEKQR